MRSLLVLLAASHCAFVAAADCGATSGAQTAAFVELYTSEGCSSWPPAKHLTLAVVPLQNGLSTRVTAGENKGEQLANDYVVRDMASVKVAKREASLEFEFKARPGWNAQRMSVAAFLQDTETGEVLQALAAPSCR